MTVKKFFDRIKTSSQNPHEFIRNILCMLSKKDIQMFEKMFSNVVTQDTLRDILRENNEVFGSQLKREMRDEIHAVVNGAVFASEERMMKKMDEMKEEILDGVSDIIGNEILPQIDECQRDIVQLKLAVKIA